MVHAYDIYSNNYCKDNVKFVLNLCFSSSMCLCQILKFENPTES